MTLDFQEITKDVFCPVRVMLRMGLVGGFNAWLSVQKDSDLLTERVEKAGMCWAAFGHSPLCVGEENARSVLQIVIDGSHHTYLFNMRSVLVAVGNGEKALRGRFYLT